MRMPGRHSSGITLVKRIMGKCGTKVMKPIKRRRQIAPKTDPCGKLRIR